MPNCCVFLIDRKCRLRLIITGQVVQKRAICKSKGKYASYENDYLVFWQCVYNILLSNFPSIYLGRALAVSGVRQNLISSCKPNELSLMKCEARFFSIKPNKSVFAE